MVGEVSIASTAMTVDDNDLIAELREWVTQLYQWREHRLAGLIVEVLQRKTLTLYKNRFMRSVEAGDEPLKSGTRVYVRSLDVFGKVVGWRQYPAQDLRFTYHIQCEAPMPSHTHSCTRAGLYMEEKADAAQE